jgi:quinol monooxygenase YgiN
VIITFIKLLPQSDKRQAMIDILKSMQALTRPKPDCICCTVYEQANDTHAVLYVEQWQTKEAFDRHVQSSMYMRLLTAIELGSDAPDIQFHVVSQTSGIEMIEALRSGSSG